MELIGFTWVLRENSAITQVNNTNVFEESKLGETIEWEWKAGYKPSYSLEKLVSHEFHTSTEGIRPNKSNKMNNLFIIYYDLNQLT